MDKVLEFSLRSIICILNGDEEKAIDYKNSALDIYEEIKYKDKCLCRVEDHVPRKVKKELYELVS